VAARVLPAFADGVWLSELAPITDSTRLVDAVAAALRVPERSIEDTEHTIIDVIADRPVLLVLDNCEHVIDAAARLVQRIVKGCGRLHVLATSREALGITGEHTVRVPSMPADEAARLFIDRAVAADHGFHLDEPARAAIDRVCARLDGIPLAVELAAARAATLPVAEIERRLDHRFRLLTGGSRGALERHQTL
jgi:predicted ATPase